MTLTDQIKDIIRRADIDAGVAVWHIESDTRLDVNGDTPFPMASVFKIPILAVACQQLTSGALDLDRRIPLHDEDKSPGSGILPYFEAGLQPTVRDLLTLMIIISDNSATDIMVRTLGGAGVIEHGMRQLGINEIHFKYDCKGLLRFLFPDAVADLPLEQLQAWSMENDILRDSLAFSRGPENNVSTANAMNRLLHQLWRGEIGDGETRDLALEILAQQQFNVRLSRFLPPHVKVAHKTGTIGGIRNDSGIIGIGESNHVILTLFTAWDEAPVWNKPPAHHQRVFEVETAMGDIGLAVYEAFAKLA